MIERLKKIAESLIIPVLAVVVALTISWVLLQAAQYDASRAFAALFSASFRNIRAIATTLVKMTPLLFTGIAVALAFRGNVFNIGAEGQFLGGAIMAAWVGVAFEGLPAVLLIPVVLLFGFFAGAAVGFIPGYLKARYNVSEVITTIMFNYIMLRMLGYVVKGPLKDPTGGNPQTAELAKEAFLPTILPGTHLHLGFAVGVILAVILYFVLFRTYIGYEVRAVGFNRVAAKCNGINVQRTTILTMMASAGLAGIGGAVEMMGVAHRLYEGFSPGYGYTAIAVSILAANNPISVIFSATLFGVLNVGAAAMQRMAQVSSVFVYVLQGIIIIFIAVSTVPERRFRFDAIGGIFKKKRQHSIEDQQSGGE